MAVNVLADHGNNSRLRRMFALFLVAIFLVLFARMIAPFFEAIVLAAAFSGLLYPLYARLRRRVRREWLAALATTVLALIVVVLPLTILVGVLTKEAVHVSEVVAPWVDGKNDARDLSRVVPEWLPYRNQLLARAGEVVNQTGTFVVQRLSRATQSSVIFLLNLFVMLYAMFFFFVRGGRLLAFLDEYTPLDSDDKRVIAAKGLAITRATLKSTLIIGALQGTAGGIAFAAAGIDGAMFWGIVMGVASALPTLGTALVWVPATLVLYLRGQPVVAFWFGAWCAVVVSGLDNLVRPWLVGNDAKMPDLLVLLSTLGGIAMFGAAGIIIGPVLAGLFLTSLEIFTATFGHELRRGAATAPPLLEPDGELLDSKTGGGARSSE
ncbi:MAG TPA: AI-2E family transporter [Gammaproteobacteria bacterium]|nr:AI-2E family transporter [Gammaproteobacteria bacterium]